MTLVMRRRLARVRVAIEAGRKKPRREELLYNEALADYELPLLDLVGFGF